MSYKAVVLATGATTIELPGFKFDGSRVIGAKEAVSLREIPKRLRVIGGGVIGLEPGTVYQKLGSQLFVAEALPKNAARRSSRGPSPKASRPTPTTR